jgi:nucleoside triphosphate pyrophosphatase
MRLNDVKLILASASPRRQELLAHLGLEFEVVVSGFVEPSVMTGRPAAVARRLAAAKALDVAAGHRDAAVLAADTVVSLRGNLLGKPAGACEARAMLRELRERVHRVTTGLALITPARARPRVAHTVSKVRMRPYTDAEIEAAIEAGVPFDKAGGYGIQDPVLHPVEQCEGCYCNVMGLPLWTVVELLDEAGIGTDATGLPERCRICPAMAAASAP